MWAALDLSDQGAAAKAGVPALTKLLADPDPDLRFAAGYSLARIESDLPALRQLLASEMGRAARGRPATWVTAVAFERLPPDFPELVPLVARWLEREGESRVLMAGLRKYGPKAKDAVPALKKVLRGPSVPVHGYMGSGLRPACEALERSVRTPAMRYPNYGNCSTRAMSKSPWPHGTPSERSPMESSFELREMRRLQDIQINDDCDLGTYPHPKAISHAIA